MAIAFRSIANTTYASRTNTTVTAPSGIVDDDVLLLFGLTLNTTSPTMTPPSGFAAVSLASGTNPTVRTSTGIQLRMWCWWKRAASEAGNYTITHTVASSQGFCLAISGALTSGTPIDAATSNGSDNNTTSTGNAVTTTVADTLLVWGSHDWGDFANNLTAPSGMTERLDTSISYSATQAIAATGSTGNRTMTNNNQTHPDSEWAVFLVAIKPAVATLAIPPFQRRSRFFKRPF